MARIEESIEIGLPVDKLFSFTTDAKSWPKWQTFLPEAEQISEGSMNVGSTYRGIFRMMGLGIETGGKVGDQMVTVNVEIPKKLTPEDKKLFERLAASLNLKH